MTDLRNIDPRDTEFISVHQLTPNTLRFRFNVRLRAMDSSIYHVHSFRYWDNLTHTPSLLEYQGREYVLWNKTANCIKGIDKPIDRAVLDECSEYGYKDPDLNIWRNIVTTNNVYLNNVASYKHSKSANYIYCFPWNVTINGETTRCPVLMFRLDPRLSFSTRNITYKGIHRKILLSFSEQSFYEGVSLAHFDENKIASNQLSMFDRIQELQSINDGLVHDQEVSIIVTKHGFAYWLTIFVVGILCVICISLLVYILKITNKVHAQNKTQSIDLQEIKKTYEATSCINCSNTSSKQQQTTIVSSTPLEKHSVDATNQPITINFANPRPLPLLPSNM